MSVRVDKWLWSIRLYKTRTIATDACRSGKVSMDGRTLKASKEINIGDEIEVHKDYLHLKVKVLQLSEKRMGAALVGKFMEDITSDEEYAKAEAIKSHNFEFRQRGSGRPTKRDRRDLTHLKDK